VEKEENLFETFVHTRPFAVIITGLIKHVRRWLSSELLYTVRYRIGVLMKFCLDEAVTLEYAQIVANVQFDHYYVKMMVAWYFATALVKQYHSAIFFLKEHRLDFWPHNKII